jgi:hypothetical protein
LDLDQGVSTPSYPTDNFENFPVFLEPILLPEVGTLDFVDYQVEYGLAGTLLKLQFNFTNASGGYDVNPNIGGYFIGNDGLARQYAFSECPQSTVGPGLTKELAICTFIPDSLQNIVLVIVQPIKAAFGLETQPAPVVDPQSSPPAGVWEGTAEERGTQYSVIMTLESCSQASQCGSISYPELSCNSQLTFVGVQDQQYVFNEAIADGPCVDGGTIRIHPQVEENSWTWSYPDGRVSAFATLQKTK